MQPLVIKLVNFHLSMMVSHMKHVQLHQIMETLGVQLLSIAIELMQHGIIVIWPIVIVLHLFFQSAEGTANRAVTFFTPKTFVVS